MKGTYSCTFRKLDNIGLSVNFILYDGNYNKMDEDGISMPRPQFKSPQKNRAILAPTHHNEENIDDITELLSVLCCIVHFILLTSQRSFFSISNTAPSHAAHACSFATYHSDWNRVTTPVHLPVAHQLCCADHTAYSTTSAALHSSPYLHSFHRYQG